jgi:hypothetical protein
MLCCNVILTGKLPRMHFFIPPRYTDSCLVKRSWALRGRNPTRDNRAEGRVKDVPLPWRLAPGQPSLAVL